MAMTIDDPTSASPIPVSDAIPSSWLADEGQRTPNGGPATFRSVPHAGMGIRLSYRHVILSESDDRVRQEADRYQSSWDQIVRHCAVIRQIVDLIDIDLVAAGMLWNAIDQPAVDSALRVVILEREPHEGRNLATHAWREFRIGPAPFHPDVEFELTRRGTGADNNAAWGRAPYGTCNGCGMLTVSDSQRSKLHRTMEKHPDLFDLSPTYEQANGKAAPLWNIMTIIAKGVAEHVVPRSRGGATDTSNLTNCCSCCNYTRGDTSLDLMGAPAYRRPPVELDHIQPSS